MPAPTDDQKIAVVTAIMRKDADDSGYGRFVPDAWIAKLATDAVTALNNLEQGKTI